MDKPTHMYDVLRGRGRFRYNKAVIAARFEDCTQNLTRLSSTCLSLNPRFPEAKAKSLSDVLGRFVAWGNETGAVDQTLDHRLRKAKEMHDNVANHLAELQLILQDGMELSYLT
jgi:hypothetical protein